VFLELLINLNQYDAILHLVELMIVKNSEVRCNAAFTLANFAGHPVTQQILIKKSELVCPFCLILAWVSKIKFDIYKKSFWRENESKIVFF